MRVVSRTIQVIICLALLVGLVGPAVVPGAAVAKAHPLLLQLAAQDAQQEVAVIVQKAGQGNRLEARVAGSGGQVTQDLHIINAFAARMTAGEAVALSGDSDVRWVSLDAAVERSGKPAPTPTPTPITTNTYLDTTGARQVWNMGITGSGIGVAVIDSGITNSQDLPLVRSASFNPNSTMVVDVYGHGTHVAGIIANRGVLSYNKFKGVAPGASLISLKVSDETGMAYESDVVAALQWIYDNKAQYNIRVANVSLNSTVEQSYNTSPLAAACEIVWFSGVVVVVSSGNATGATLNYANAAPANDPFVITVGAADELTTASTSDDVMATYTAWTITSNGVLKPDIFAPGSNIISSLSDKSDWDVIAPDRVVDGQFFRLSGTSMAAPVVTGAIALLLQDEPNLTPDQVKYRLLNSYSRQFSIKVSKTLTVYFPYLDAYKAVTGTSTASANTGQLASQLLWSGTEPITWSSVAWNSVAWNSVAWNSVAWNSVAWNSVAWNSAYWGP